MNTSRVKEWVVDTKLTIDDAHNECVLIKPIGMMCWLLTKAVVYALLTIAIAIHEAAESKGKK